MGSVTGRELVLVRLVTGRELVSGRLVTGRELVSGRLVTGRELVSGRLVTERELVSVVVYLWSDEQQELGTISINIPCSQFGEKCPIKIPGKIENFIIIIVKNYHLNSHYEDSIPQ